MNLKFGFGFDTTQNGKTISLINEWLYIESEIADYVVNNSLLFLSDNNLEINSNDILYFTGDINYATIAHDKLQEYNSNIKITTDINEASVIVADIKNSIYALTSTQKTTIYTYPVKSLLPYISEASRLDKKDTIDIDNDVVFISDEIIDKSGSMFDRKLVKTLDINFSYVFSRSELMWIGYEPLLSIYHAITNKKRVLSHINYARILNKNGILLDMEMWDTINQMLSSGDKDSSKLVCNILSNCNRTESLPYLLLAYNNFHNKFKGELSDVHEFNSFMNDVLDMDSSTKNITKTLSKLGKEGSNLIKFLK